MTSLRQGPWVRPAPLAPAIALAAALGVADPASAVPCGEITFEGCCSAEGLKYCSNGALEVESCSGQCGWVQASSFYACGGSGADPSGVHPFDCPVPCAPACAGKACGPDGCGGTCGACGAGETCSATGQCEPPSASCGGACGQEAPAGCWCDADCVANGDCCDDACAACGHCPPCEPACAGKACGPDGCGGSCGACGEDESCTASGLCEASEPPAGECAGFCGGKAPSGCWCDAECAGSGDCCPDVCVECGLSCTCEPDCGGKTCGDNGCGGTCGACAGALVCEAGSCVDPGGACAPDCVGKTCGDDGCGGACGLCAPGEVCDTDTSLWTCAPGPSAGGCAPECGGRICGSDGCGGSCGVCPAGQACLGAGTTCAPVGHPEPPDPDLDQQPVDPEDTKVGSTPGPALDAGERGGCSNAGGGPGSAPWLAVAVALAAVGWRVSRRAGAPGTRRQ
jgi:hypothetical protein